jgi:nucleoside-diphosphate kinase
MITTAGFKIVSLKLTQLLVLDAQAFFMRVHAAKTFYGEWLNSCQERDLLLLFILEKK